MKINPNDPVQGFVDYGFADENNKGITIRTQIASMCLQGILAKVGTSDSKEYYIKYAVNYADLLIEKLNEKS